MTAPISPVPSAPEHTTGVLPVVAPTGSAPVPHRRRPYHKHGLRTLKRAVRTLGNRLIDRRTRLGKTFTAWRTDLASDLGGMDALSTQQRTLLDEAVKLMLDSVDGWVLQQPSLVHKAKRSLLPVVRERLALVGQLQSLLRALGPDRKAREMPTLGAYLAAKQPPATDGGEHHAEPTGGCS